MGGIAAGILRNDQKTELVGNLVSSRGEGLGIQAVWLSELAHLPQAAAVELWEGERKLSLAKAAASWDVHCLAVEYEGDGLKVFERKTAAGDEVLCDIRITSGSRTPRTIAVRIEGCMESREVRFSANKTSDGLAVIFANGFEARLVLSPPAATRMFEGATFPTTGELGLDVDHLEGMALRTDSMVSLEVPPGGEKRIGISLGFRHPTGRDGGEPRREAATDLLGRLDEGFQAVEKEWRDFSPSLPVFDCSNPGLTQLFYYAFYVLKSNRTYAHLPHLPRPFTSIGKFNYFHAWFWDSAFQSMAWMWCNDKRFAQEELLTVPMRQWRSGMIPHEVFVFTERAKGLWHAESTSWLTQPPVHPLAAMEIYRRFADSTAVQTLFPIFLKYDDWLAEHLDGDGDGLCAWRHVWETGWDDSPRWDGLRVGLHLDPWVESVDFNTLIYLQRLALLEMGRMSGVMGAGAKGSKASMDPAFDERAALSRVRVRLALMRRNFGRFWDPDAGFFFDLQDGSHAPIRVRTPAGFLPLLTDLVSRDQRAALMRHLLNPAEFFTECPIPTVAADDPAYEPKRMWRGPAWPNINWLVILGLVRSGERKAAADLLGTFIAAILKHGRLQADEWYDSRTGESAGTIQYGWGALWTDIVCRFICGAVPLSGERIGLDPLDIGLEHFRLGGMEYRGRSIDVAWERGGAAGPGIGAAAPGRGRYVLSVDGKDVMVANELSPRVVRL